MTYRGIQNGSYVLQRCAQQGLKISGFVFWEVGIEEGCYFGVGKVP